MSDSNPTQNPATQAPSLSADRLQPDFLAKLPDFERSDQLSPRDERSAGIGQNRAVEALEFGIDMQRPGYNIFVLGPTGSGRKTLARRTLSPEAAQRETPPDRCYVYNFEESDAPRALTLPAGRGAKLQKEMQRFVEDLDEAITSAFEADEYRLRKEALDDEYKARQKEALEKIKEKAKEHELTVIRNSMGFAIAPVRDGEVLTPAEFEKLDEAEQAKIKDKLAEVEKELEEEIRDFPKWEIEQRDRMRELNGEIAHAAMQHLIAPLQKDYAELPQIVEYLDAVLKDIVENVKHLISRRKESEDDDTSLSPRRYLVNVLVDNSAGKGAPVEFEDHPTLGNIIGRIDHRQEMGVLYTDFRLIKSGALHRANGGFLLLDANKLLQQPAAYDALKRALRSEEVRIESISESIGMGGTVSLRPEKIPLNVKIIMFGDRRLYYLLHQHDPEFRDLFKIAVDVNDEMPDSSDNVESYARFIAEFCAEKKLRPLQRPAVARLLRQAARLSGDQERLSCHTESIGNIIYEADLWAKREQAESISKAHVVSALEAKDKRNSRISDRMREQILRGSMFIDTQGKRVGQINALSVMQIGELAFGRPNRISARVRVGRGDIVDIEREVSLGGSLHTKGVLILSSFLGARYAKHEPLALRASLVFEQSYGGIDGDSASSTELYALLSAISEIPLRQDLAVTGSVNQFGEIQPIGGVNEKIEGFFEICKERGLSGTQGVLIPHSNEKNLILNDEVVAAVQEGRFHVYSVSHIDQGIEILSGVAAGKADEKGEFPEGSFNARVAGKLKEFAQTARRLSSPKNKDEDDNEDEQKDKGDGPKNSDEPSPLPDPKIPDPKVPDPKPPEDPSIS